MVESDELSEEEEEEEEDRDDEQRFGLASTILSNYNFVIWRGGGGGEGAEGAEAGAGGRAVDLYSLLFRGRSEVVAMVMVAVAVAVLL